MYTSELFTQAETRYRHDRYLREAAEDRLARSVPGHTSRLAALVAGFKALTSADHTASRPAPCAG